MINKNSDIKHEGLRSFWESGGKNTAGIQQAHAKRLKILLVHLDTARSLNDIAEGLGKSKHFHKLEGYNARYSLKVDRIYRVTFDCDDSSTGVVTIIDYEDYH